MEANESAGIIFNVTVKVDRTIASEWLQWMRQDYIPRMLQTGCFTSHRIVRLLDIDDTEGPTYAIQYQASSRADYNRYARLYAAQMQKNAFERWGNRFIGFHSVMEIVD